MVSVVFGGARRLVMKFQNWNANYRLSLGLAFLLVIWMATGVFSTEDNEEKIETEARQFSVEALTSKAQRYQRSIYVRGRSEANRSVFVAAEVEGLVVDTPVLEGSFVKKGEPLCVLESQDRLLRLEQAKAQRDKAEIDYEGALRLKDRGYQSKTQIAAAKASLAVAEAELKSTTLSRDKLTILAPFDGVVQERMVEVGGFVQRGSHCVRLIELSPLVLVGQLSESDISFLTIGDVAQVNFQHGKTFEGKVRYISRAADSATRTFRVEIEIDNTSMDLAEGMSADLTIYTDELKAHEINSSLLSLIDDERIGVKILDPQNRVQVTEVRLVGDSQNGVWVTGLADTVTLITVGQEYVSEGSVVKLISTDGAEQAPPSGLSAGSMQ